MARKDDGRPNKDSSPVGKGARNKQHVWRLGLGEEERSDGEGHMFGRKKGDKLVTPP